jgi:hypothetical protein
LPNLSYVVICQINLREAGAEDGIDEDVADVVAEIIHLTYELV